jgi:seryl-tRNA synthetase
MLDPAILRDHPDLVRAAVKNRGADPEAILGPLGPLDQRRRALILEVETLKREQNEAAEDVARRKKAGEDIGALADANRARGQQVKERDVAL